MKLTKTIPLVIITSLLAFYACKKKEKSTTKEEIKEEVLATYNKVIDTSLCESSWFPHSQTPAPEEGKGSPFDVSSTTNGIFHQWSWQKFLWLTKPDGEANLPLFLNSTEAYQVDSHLGKIAPISGASVVLEDTAQAGSSGILRTNPAYNPENNQEETVFYSIHVSPTLFDAAQKFKDSIIGGTLAKNNLSSFPVGSLELKVSWVTVDAIPENKRVNYFTTTGAINDGNGNFTNTEVALLGMHVVGVVENHPEFIWATFEHDDLAPNYNWKEDKATSDTDKLLFAKGTTTGIKGIYWDTITKQALELYKNYDLFKYGVPLDNKGDFMKTCQQEPINFDNIKNINACVKENLDKEEGPWKHYFYNGSIWVDTDGLTTEEQAKLLVNAGSKLDKATSGSPARGSLNNANVTMETYTQTFKSELSDINVNNLANCFSCHNAVSYTGDTSPIYLSHIFDAFIKGAEGKTKSEVEKLKAKQEVEDFMRKKLN
ncbi:Cytochrome c family protein [Tenacibaculum sp. 190130A14a]|uniref:Cytochrome c family protein n=1 Tax=Tenacibaculum polynesiense TaxID=3137857 RepID=A0ABM9P6I2_9FLAO